VWDHLTQCSCFIKALKESDSSLLEDLNGLSEQDKAATKNAILSDREMRDMIVDCSSKEDSVAKTVGLQTSDC